MSWSDGKPWTPGDDVQDTSGAGDAAGVCPHCFPPAATLVELAGRARNREAGLPYVGDGGPDTAFACAHGSWRLGDLETAEETEDADAADGDEARTCKEPGCDSDAAKNRNWCNTHASPKNRAGDG